MTAAVDTGRVAYERPSSALGHRTSFSRPFSPIAESVAITEDALSTSSRCFSTKEGVTNVTGRDLMPNPSRPVSALISQLVDSAHYKRATRDLQHPKTYAYTVWEWRAQESAVKTLVGNTGRLSRPPSAPSVMFNAAGGSEAGWEHQLDRISRSRPSQSGASSTISWNMQDLTCPASQELEITCEYDSNFQPADILGRHGRLVRPETQYGIGPVAYLFRWYAKRATLFSIPPTPQDLVGAPMMPPTDALFIEVPQTPGGRYLNRSPDPVMNVEEIIEMLEEYEVVPHLVSRGDVAQAFRAVKSVTFDQPHKLSTAQVMPDEVRYPQFCDILIRLAIAAYCQASEQDGVPPPPPEQCVRMLMDVMELSNPNIIPLKHKLDAMARVAKDRGAKKKWIKWKYIAPVCAMDCARKLMQPVDGWTVQSPELAPKQLQDKLLSCDKRAEDQYRPEWRNFKEPALNLGVLQPLEVRSLRVVLRHRGQYKTYIKVDAQDVPWLQCTYNEQYMVPGLPRTIEITAKFDEVGEYVGELRIYSKTKQDHVQYVNIVPVYAHVQLPDSEKIVPRNKKSMGPLAVKNALKPGAVSRPGSAASGYGMASNYTSRAGSRPASATYSMTGSEISHSVSAVSSKGISRPVSALASRPASRPVSALHTVSEHM